MGIYNPNALEEGDVLFFTGDSIHKGTDFFDFEVKKVTPDTIHLLAVDEKVHAYDEC